MPDDHNKRDERDELDDDDDLDGKLTADSIQDPASLPSAPGQ
jgi:hypothetical protein